MAVNINRLEDYETNFSNIQNLKHKINIDLVQQVLLEKRNVNCLIQEGFTPLYLASLEGDSGLVRSLLDRGAEVNHPSKDGKSPLYVASKNGHISTVKVLLDWGAEVNLISLPTDFKETCLNVAWKHGHFEVVKILLEKGAKTNHIPETDVNYNSLDHAVRNGQAEVVTLMLDNGLRVHWKNKEGESLLFTACATGHVNIVNILLDRGIDVNCPSSSGGTPLYIACLNNHSSIVKVLMERGADANNKTTEGHQRTAAPLYLLAKEGHTELVRLLLDNGAEVNMETPVGCETPLQTACFNDHYDIVKLLLDRGANINQCSPHYVPPVNYRETSFTPLMLAIHRGHSQIVRLLLEKGARVDLKYQPGDAPPLWMCCKQGNYDIAKLLLEYGADPNQWKAIWPFIKIKPLLIATCEGHRNIVRLLLENGANIRNQNIRSTDEPNLLLAAYVDGHYDIFMDLINKSINPTYQSIYCELEEVLEHLNRSKKGYGTYEDGIVDACVESCIKTGCIRYTRHSCNQNTQMIFQQHLGKLKAVGLYNGNVSAEYQKLLKRYSEEIQNIKAFKVYNTVSLYIVFEKFIDPCYLKNQDLLKSIEKTLNSPQTMIQFPIYGQILKNRFLSSQYRLNLLTEVSEALEGQEWWDMLHLPIQEKVLLYLENRDLEEMCRN